MRTLSFLDARFHRDEGGAILLFSLAAALIIMMMAWVVYDAGPVARDKVELQGAADAAAYSQSAVKARANNLIAYANVAKRSIIAITALYPMMYVAYSGWMAYHFGKCHKTWPNLSSCYKFYTNLPQFVRETTMDFPDYGGWWGILWADTFGLLGSPGGNMRNYHRRDIQALDNTQRYMFHIAPWWAWTEGVVRGMRNGATANASWPVPSGMPAGGFPRVVEAVTSFLNSISINGAPPSGGPARDQLPWLRDGWRRGDFTSGASAWETAANVAHHTQRSSRGARDAGVIAAGTALYFLRGWRMVVDYYGEAGRPWRLNNFRGEAGKWTMNTSTLVFAYKNRPERFRRERLKYRVPSIDYSFQLGALDEFTYRTSGVWTLARSEYSFQGDRPNPFRAGWTARMRPVALAGEWQSGQDLNKAYHDVLPFLAFASILGIGNWSYILSSIHDFAAMERVTRSFGPSTVEGIGK